MSNHNQNNHTNQNNHSSDNMHAEQRRSIPQLRFPEFEGEWGVSKLGDNFKIIDGDRGVNYPNSSDFFDNEYCLFLNAKNVTKTGFSFSEKHFITKEKDEILRKGKLELDDIVLTTRGSVGHFAHYNSNVNFQQMRINSGMVLLRNVNGDVNTEFIYKLSDSPKLRKQISIIAFGSAQPQLTVKEISKFKLAIPTLPEQQKIASFLTAQDDYIASLEKEEQLLQAYKKGIMQRIFCQHSDSDDLYDKHDLKSNKSGQSQKSKFRLRFKDDKGNPFPEWEEKKLGEVFERVTTKNKENNLNVLTISAQQGLINQEEFFNKSVSAKDVTGYYLLKSGDFAYNKSYSKGYPMGAIKKLNKYDKGVVSTLYICFRPKINIAAVFYEQFFETTYINKQLHKIAQEGARNHGLLNMSVVEFFNDIHIPFPCFEEQQKIATFLAKIDEQIDGVKTQIEQAKAYKKGLLQKMFV